MKKKTPKIKRIKLSVKKANKIFATVISRGSSMNERGDSKSLSKEDQGEDEAPDSKIRLFSPLASHVLCKQLEGATNYEEGTTGLWAMRTAKGYGAILEEDHPFEFGVASRESYLKFLKTPISVGALKNASSFRTFWYERLLSVDDVIRSLVFTPSMLSFQIFKGIRDAPGGFVPMPYFWERSKDNHSVSIIGYDNEKKVLKFFNSWGKDWGDRGIGYLPYDYVKRFLVESWASMRDVRKGQRGTIKQVGEYEFEFLTYRSLVGGRQNLQVIDVYKDAVIAAWAHFRYYENYRRIEIEEIFVMPKFRRQGIAGRLLSYIEENAAEVSALKIVAYIHVQDLVTEERIASIEELFSAKKGYEVFPQGKKFRGSAYRAEKIFTI